MKTIGAFLFCLFIFLDLVVQKFLKAIALLRPLIVNFLDNVFDIASSGRDSSIILLSAGAVKQFLPSVMSYMKLSIIKVFPELTGPSTLRRNDSFVKILLSNPRAMMDDILTKSSLLLDVNSMIQSCSR